jgi:hypothetical protein
MIKKVILNKHISILFAIVLFVTLLLVLEFGCAPRQAADQEGNITVDIPPWSMESDCSTCHTLEVKSESDSSYLYSLHKSSFEDGCIECHDQTDKLVQVHAAATVDDATAERLKKTVVSSDTCESCHTLADLAVLTADSVVLSDSNGKTVNPHELPANDNHQIINCSDCHKMHQPKSQLAESSQMECISCHHENVYECNTCHAA